ncbi:thymidine phosphorylase [Phyllobacterium sp. 21LDTY02-6]|uniref:thymidine phosphorylase n=1 Tax=Phyllobacterium sp. 21LDTY02-6 TaxID=2944903 RepID=UPI00201FB9AF|nr:thymidine phosphorylase [Phyllobacterium sp. 21LDTY02-6]MCO4317090.1 thymidine phosphorylase [Phyllobacterium sp. 21LDTY02-6]
MVLPQEIIRRKRDGHMLEASAIAAFVEGLGSGRVTEGQVAAFAMAVFFQGMRREETVALTLAMLRSGDVLDWSHLPGPAVDKHSTGGVGDNVSLMLAPIAAACGAYVPMISGRGLGHTGGTLDKMDSIPGYRSQPDNALFRNVVRDVGCAIIGQTANLAPADKRFYAIRDVTATVESIPLITASILSKKLSAGLGALVMDVKAGSGAFMARKRDAVTLAESIVAVAEGAGLPTTALLTDMNEPLALAAGNAVEVRNAVRFLTGERRDARLETVTIALVAEMLLSAGLASTQRNASAMAQEALNSGKAAEIFGRMVAALGGPADFIERMDHHLPQAPVLQEVKAPAGGYVAAIDTRALGMAVVQLGGGRTRPQDPVDHAVGITALQPIGARMEKDEPIALIHARSEDDARLAVAKVLAAYGFAERKPRSTSPILRRISAAT